MLQSRQQLKFQFNVNSRLEILKEAYSKEKVERIIEYRKALNEQVIIECSVWYAYLMYQQLLCSLLGYCIEGVLAHFVEARYNGRPV